jgi:hypothetical protein
MRFDRAVNRSLAWRARGRLPSRLAFAASGRGNELLTPHAMKRFAFAVFGVALLLATAPTGASAQRIDSPYRFVERNQSLGFYGGWVGASAATIDVGPQSGPAFGLRYRIRLSGAFDGEVDVSAIPTNRFVTDTIRVGDGRRVLGEAPMALVNAQAGLRFNVTGPRTFHGVQPFVLFGGGVVIDAAGRDALDEELPEDARYRFGTSFAGQFGAGTEWYATDRISLRLDARNVLWRMRTPDAFRRGDAARLIPETQWKRNLVFAAGVGLHF